MNAITTHVVITISSSSFGPSERKEFKFFDERGDADKYIAKQRELYTGHAHIEIDKPDELKIFTQEIAIGGGGQQYWQHMEAKTLTVAEALNLLADRR